MAAERMVRNFRFVTAPQRKVIYGRSSIPIQHTHRLRWGEKPHLRAFNASEIYSERGAYMNMSTTLNQSRRAINGASGVHLLAGAWLIISPFALSFSQVPSAMWNNVACGIAIAVLAITRLNAIDHLSWSWAMLLLAVWVILSPWALGFAQNGAADLDFNSELVWNNVIIGAVVAFLAVFSMLGGHAIPPISD
jgi:hypothetical protein